jgi:hypothetical protein
MRKLLSGGLVAVFLVYSLFVLTQYSLNLGELTPLP